MTTPAKPLAVVTGASSGIGYELARQVASKVAPDTAKAAMHRRMSEPGSASE